MSRYHRNRNRRRAKQLDTLRSQRDRLREALTDVRNIIASGHEVHCGYGPARQATFNREQLGYLSTILQESA